MALDTVTEGVIVQPDGPRDPDLPSMYRVTNHPLMKRVPDQDSTAIVYLADLTNEGCLKSVVVSGRQRIPGPGRQNMLNSGAIVTYPGETIFVRDINGTGNPLSDREHSYVVGKSKQSPTTIVDMDAIADRIIGDERDCTADAPVPPGEDHGIGGTAFERSFRAKPLRGTTRAYNLGPSYEIQSNSSAPHASGKMFHNEWDDHLDLQKDIIKTHITASMKGLEYGPPGLLENLQRHAGLVPMPRIGTDDNVAFTSVQLNISPVGTIGSDPLTSLGAFGSEHIDVNDSENTFSAAGAYSTLDDDLYDPGYFFYLDIMVCVRMDQGVIAYFSGLRPHGSSGAIRLTGTPPPNAYRIVLVAYAVREILEAYTIMPIAALPGKDDHMHDRVLNLYPEMTPNIYTYEGRHYSTHANYITDGETIMTRRSHLQFIVYSLCFILCYVLNQFPASYRVMFDTKKFCELITILDEDGNRIQSADWTQRPTMNAFLIRPSTNTPTLPNDTTSNSPLSARVYTSGVIEPGDNNESATRESDMDALSCEAREGFRDNFLFETLPDRSVRPEHLKNLAHVNPVREHDAIIWEKHAERYAYMIPIARLSRSRETAAGVVYVPGVPGGRPPTKGSKYRALINRAKRGKTLTLDGKDGRDDVPTSSDRIQVSGKRAGRGLVNTPVNTVGHDSTRKRKRKGPIANNTLTAAADHDSDVNESQSGDDDNDYIPNGSGYSISKGVKQNPRSVKAKVVTGIAKENTVTGSTYGELPLTSQHSELSLQVSSELQTTITASESTVHTRRNPVVDTTRPPLLTDEVLFADIESSDDDIVMSADEVHAIPPVLTRLSLPVINAVSGTMAKSALAMRQRYTTGALPRRPPIDQILQPILLKPYSVSAGLSVATLWENMPSLKDGILLSSFDVAIQRQDLMLLNHAAWKWLRRVCLDYCWSYLLNGGDADNWIKELTSTVDGVLNTAQNSFTLSSSSYLPRAEVIEYYWSITASSKHLCGPARHTYILRIVTEVVRLWLGFPVHGVEQAQSRLVELAVNNFSSDVLLLETFWISYNRFKSHVIGDRKITKVLEHHFDALLAHIASHPLADPNSPERSALSNIGRIVNAYRFGTLFREDFDLTFADLPPTVNSRAVVDDVDVRKFLNARPSLMLKFLLLSLNLLDPSLPSNSLTDHIESDLNYFLPFREHAPDRIRSRACHGPFDPDKISTPTALFCALWWRGISFGTCFSRRETMDFTLEEVTEYYEWSQHKFGESAASIYFCDPSIFGSYNPGRTIASGQRFWEASNTHSSWLLRSDPPTYLAQYNFFRSSYVQHQDHRFERLAFTKNSRGNKIKIFPQIGDLVAHLLTADYVYGGKVKMPSVEEMGGVIYVVNKGAVSGLRLLGYFSADRPSRAVVIAAFRHLYDFLLGKLIARYVSLMTFDVIMLEHALCKLTRARNNGWI